MMEAPTYRERPTAASCFSSTMTIGVDLWAWKVSISLATSSAAPSPSPTAHTRMSGSHDRSMCFLSSVTSKEIDL